MITTGIIAEYNPFHNGHEYLLSKAKSKTNADFLAVVKPVESVEVRIFLQVIRLTESFCLSLLSPQHQMSGIVLTVRYG